MAKNTRLSRSTSSGKRKTTAAGPLAKRQRTGKARYVYYFGDGHADGYGNMKPLLGGKGANLAEMTRIGLPVPPGFTITTEVCTYYYDNKRTYPKELQSAGRSRRRQHGKILGKKFGDKNECRCWSRFVPARAIRCPA